MNTMQKPKLLNTHRREESLTSSQHGFNATKKTSPAPIDPKIVKQVKFPSTQQNKSPIRKLKNSISSGNIQIYHQSSSQSNLPANSKISRQNDFQIQQSSRITNMSTSGSYSSTSFNQNETMKYRQAHGGVGASVVDMSHLNLEHSRQLSTNNVSSTFSMSHKNSIASTKSGIGQTTNQQKRIIHKGKGKSVSLAKSTYQRQINQQDCTQNFSPEANNKENDSEIINIETPAIIKNTSQTQESTLKPSTEKIMINLRPTSSLNGVQKCSFKDSFVDSENFMNVEEKDPNDEYLSTPTTVLDPQRDVYKQKSLGQLIKERYIGPLLQNQNGNSASFMRRNVLLTTSNCSNRSSACSIKSSFLNKQSRVESRLGQKSSFQEPNETSEDIEENPQRHCCDSINQYSFMPKTIFNELVTGMQLTTNQSQVRISNLSQTSNQQKLNEFITSVPQQYQLIPNIQVHNQRSSNLQDKSFQNSDYSSNRPSRQTCSNASLKDNNLVNDLESQQQEESNSSSNQEDIIEFLQSDTHKMHLIQTLQSLQYVKFYLKQPSYDQIVQKRVNLPQFKKPYISKTIIFDLDETLVHCVEDIYNNKADKLIKVQFPNGEVAQAGINIRPYALECLRRASQLFQIVVFTASHKSYADVVLDILDPKNEIFEMRLYRESCVRSQDGVYVKDLRIFEHCRSLSDLVLVDNAVYSFGYQLENGIPIIPFYEDKEDEELLHLSQYLECLAKNGGDVREHNRKAFQLRELQELDVQQFLQNMIQESQLLEQQDKSVSQQSKSNQGNTQWEILQVDSSIINEDPLEEEESSLQESNKTNKRRAFEKVVHEQFIPDNSEEGEDEDVVDELEFDEVDEENQTIRESQRVHTSTSILERDYYD